MDSIFKKWQTPALIALSAITLWAGGQALIHKLYPSYLIHGVSMTPNIEPERIYPAEAPGVPTRHNIYMFNPALLNSKHVDHPDGDYIKRLVGLPGDTLQFQLHDGALISINGLPVTRTQTNAFRSFSMTSKLKESKGASFDSHPYILAVGDVHYAVYEPAPEAFKSTDPRLKDYLKTAFHFPWLAEHATLGQDIVTIKVPDGYLFALSDNRVAGADSRHFGLFPAAAMVKKVHLTDDIL